MITRYFNEVFMLRNSIFTIDVEEYFHTHGISGAPPVSEWDSLPGRVETNLHKFFDLLSLHNVKATCFFLGYIAKKYPNLVKEAHGLGHEIASHGMYHQLIYDMKESDFLQDALSSRQLLEDISGTKVLGFRSPCFSATDKNPWLFDKLVEAGYEYDSSMFPASRDVGGIKSNKTDPHWINTKYGKLYEFPISIKRIMGKNICFFGGGYLRLFPRAVIIKMDESLYQAGSPVLYYIHPREIDPSHPRLETGLKQRFKSYVNLNTVEPKLEAILKKGSFLTCKEYYNNHAE